MAFFQSLVSSDQDEEQLLSDTGSFPPAATSNSFFTNLYPLLFDAELTKNDAVSPYGVYSVITLALSCLGGDSESEFRTALGLAADVDICGKWGGIIRRLSKIPQIPVPQANCVFMNLPTELTTRFKRRIVGTMPARYGASFHLGINRFSQVEEALAEAPEGKGVFSDFEPNWIAKSEIEGVFCINGVCWSAEWKTRFVDAVKERFYLYGDVSDAEVEEEGEKDVPSNPPLAPDVNVGESGGGDDEMDMLAQLEAEMAAENEKGGGGIPSETPDSNIDRGGPSVMVDMMRRDGSREFYGSHRIAGVEFQSLSLFYNGQMLMLFVLPKAKGDFVAFQAKLLSQKPNILSTIRTAQSRQYLAQLAIPRFVVDTVSPNLVEFMKGKGVTKPFDVESADFTGAFLSRVKLQTCVSSLRQWTMIGVREDGKVPHRKLRDPRTSRSPAPSFVCDRPFYCFVMHDRLAVCLAAARIGRPRPMEDM